MDIHREWAPFRMTATCIAVLLLICEIRGEAIWGLMP